MNFYGQIVGVLKRYVQISHTFQEKNFFFIKVMVSHISFDFSQVFAERREDDDEIWLLFMLWFSLPFQKISYEKIVLVNRLQH